MKKLAKYVSSVLLCLFSSILLVACGEPTITKAYIKEGTIVTTVDRGSEKTALKLNDAIAVIEFSDGSKIEVDATKLSFGDIDLTTVGNDKALKVKYGDFEFEIDIDVVKPHVTNAYIKAGTVNTSVVVGQALNLSNATAVVTYSNGEVVEVDAADLGFNMATIDLTTIGNNKPLKITYDGYNFYININVVADPDDAIVRATAGIITKGTIADTVIEGATVADLNLDNATALITYDNGTSETVELDSVNFNTANLDLNTVGTKTIYVTYVYNTDKNLSITFPVQITVNPTPEEQKIAITSFTSNLKTEFESNSGTQVNKQTEFATTGKTLVVGDDNALDFRINAKGVVEGNIVENIQGVKTQLIVKLDNQELSASEYEKYVESTTYNSIDFTENAIGKTFEVVVTATNYDKDYSSVAPSFSLTFQVVDGYNVYNAKELSLFDNTDVYNIDEEGYENQWASLKQTWGLADIHPSALVLQNSIHITDEDVPSTHFYQENEYDYSMDSGHRKFTKTNQEIVGSFKDGAGEEDMVYFRYMFDGDEFKFYGNYFDINIADETDSRGNVTSKGLSRSVVSSTDNSFVYVKDGDSENSNSYLNSHSALFKVNGAKWVDKTNNIFLNSNRGGQEISSTAKVEIYDTYFIGNSPRSMDPLASGGLSLLKSECVNLHVENTISNDFYITWFTENGWDQTGLNKPTQNQGESDSDFETRVKAWAKENSQIINYGTERNSVTTIEKSKGYNGYNTFFYIWGTPNVTIADSEFVSCGGPVIIADHVVGEDWNDYLESENYFDPTSGFGGFSSEVDIYNCKMESYVNGLEAWFASFGATSLFAQVATANVAYTPVGSTFLKDYEGIPNAMNMIAITKWGGVDLSTQVFTRGFVRIFDTKEEYENYYDNSKTLQYYGLDRSITYVDAYNRYVYSGNGALKQQTALQEQSVLYASSKNKDVFELARFENSYTGKTFNVGATSDDVNWHLNKPESDDTTYSYAGRDPQGKTYLNGYLLNGYGIMIELFPYTTA